MANDTVESLNIQLSADANKATQALNSLANSLRSINDVFTKDIAGMRKFSKELGTMTTAIRSFSQIKINVPDFSGISKAFKGMEGTSGAQTLTDGIEKVVSSFEKLSGLDFNDSGINKTVNALNRLFKTDFNNFNPDNFKKITEAISSLGNMPDVSSSVNRFVSSLARLANAGEKTGQSANDILRLGEQTRLAAQQLNSIGAINDDINIFVQSIAKLSSAGAKTGQTASGLKSLADETVKFFNAMSQAPKISENTIRMTQALAQLASAGGRVSTSTSTVTSAFSRLSSIGSNTASALKKAASTIVSAFTQIGNSGKRVDSARLSLGNLLKTAVGFQIGYGLINFGKQAFELGSAITEVENVVNVAFGDMSQQAYDFASTATEQFGLSELAAKQYAGTMMAMLNSTGVAQDAAAEMSTTLAGLAGDLASFYNIDTDEAFRKLRSAMAGETEPMRELGVNMTVTALESYALSQGITESWQSMTQAEQAMLRYNYIMSATSQQQGDFQRTVGSFANQWRLLTLNVQQFSATIGQGLIAAVLPAIQAINALFSVLQRAATAFRNFMYVLTGYEGESSGGFVTDTATGLEGIGSAGTDAAGGMGDAADAADDLKKKLSVLPFDELNQLSDNLSDAGSAGGGGGTGGLGDLGGLTDLGSVKDAFEKSDLPEYVNEWAERIRDAFLDHDWNRLGEEIAWGLNKGLKKIYDVINWKKVGPKITKFVDAFTDTLNSLVDNIDFRLMGNTIGAGFNTLVQTLERFFDRIDFKNIGRKLSDELEGFIDEVDWRKLGNLIGNYFMYTWDIFYGFVTDLNFEKVGKAISDGLEGVFQKINLSTIAAGLYRAFNGVFETLGEISSETDWDMIANNISSGLNTFIHGVKWEEAGKNLSNFVMDLLGVFADVAAETDWQELGEGIGNFLSQIDWWGILSQVFTIITNVLGGLITGLKDTTAGKFIIAFGALKAADLLSPLINLFKSDSTANLFSGSIKTLCDKIKELFTSNFKDWKVSLPNQNVTYQSGNGLAGTLTNAGVSAVLGEQISRTLFSNEASKYEDLLMALGELEQQGYATSEVIDDIAVNLNVAIQQSIPFEESMYYVRQAMEEAGYDTEGFNAALESAFDNLGILAPSAERQAEILGAGLVEGASTGVNNSKGLLNSALTGVAQGAISTITPQVRESVSQTLQAINEGASVGTSQIQEVFSVMGITIPQTMADAFASMEPTLLTATLNLLSQLNNGESLKYDELVTAFTNLGLGITNTGLIETLSGQSANVQQATIMLLSQIETGKSLSENQLVYAFQSLGIGIVNDGIISSLANAEPDVQQQAIDLLGQIQSAADTERQPLIDKFNSLGVGTINDGLLSALDSLTPTARNEAIELLSQISGASDEQREKIYRKLKDVGIDAGSGLLEGMGAKDYDISEAGLGWAKEAIGGAKEGFDIHSPSKEMEKIGNYAGEGLINGLKAMTTEIQNTASLISSTILESFSSLSADMYSYGRAAIQSLANGLQSIHIPTPHLFVSSWQQLALGNGGSMSLPNFGIDWYAAGGLFRSATIAGIGEAGAEAVLPLENHRTMRMIADSIVDNSSGFGMNEEAMANAVARGVAMAMMNNQSSQPNITVYAELKTESDEVLARAVTRGQQKIDYRMNPTPQF